MQDIAYFCAASDRDAANAVANAAGGGPNNFSVPLSTSPGITDAALATHYAGSGMQDDVTANAMSTSVAPLVQVRSNDGVSFDQHLAESAPVLYKINVPI